MLNNKRGMIGIILFFVMLFVILIVGFMGAMIVGVVDYTFDEITPIMTDLGMAGDFNASQAGEFTFGTLNTIIQAFPWLIALAYVLALVASLLFVIGYNFNPHPVFIGFYIALMLLLMFGSIIMSNMYQDIYDGTDIIATQLHEQALMSYMILYSPFILLLIAVVAGVLFFARTRTGDISGGFVDV